MIQKVYSYQIHYSMLWKYAITSDSLYLLNKLLILYRRHGYNATNQFSRTPPNITQRIANIDDEIDMYRRFINASDGLAIPESNQKLMKAKIKFLTRRKNVPAKRNIFITAMFVMMNFEFYPAARNALSDIYICYNIKKNNSNNRRDLIGTHDCYI